MVNLDDLPRDVRSGPAVQGTSTRERRRQIGDDLFDSLVARRFGFWDHVRRVFLDREISRVDLRRLISRGLAATSGNYRAMAHLFGLRDEDYKRLMNFLSAHDCVVDFRPFRSGHSIPEQQPMAVPRRSTEPITRQVGA